MRFARGILETCLINMGRLFILKSNFLLVLLILHSLSLEIGGTCGKSKAFRAAAILEKSRACDFAAGGLFSNVVIIMLL